MKIDFNTAANGQQTCKSGNIQLHSSYNPSREAERFATTAECSFIPKYVIVTGPALSYCAEFLKKRFPSSMICCIRYSFLFSKFDCLWDKVFFSQDKSNEFNLRLAEEIFNYMGDEGIASCLFLSWKPSEQVFEETNNFVWNEIKKAVLKSRSVLATRTFFSSRWAKNSLRFCLFTKNTAYLQRGTSDVIVCASGPSLESNYERLRTNRDKFFLLAVSSSIRPLAENGIVPDLCISTDGGYWAKKHLSFALRQNCIPLALPGEGACYAQNFESTSIIPLYYGDGCSEKIMMDCNYAGTSALRNGSVSGTAASLALSITSGDVYYCGLDLAPNKGYVHAQPNELEINDARFDNRICTCETRTVQSNMKSGSLDIYRSWFKTTDFGGRLFRLSDNFDYAERLGEIQDVDWEHFERKNLEQKIKPQIIRTSQKFDRESRIEFLLDETEKNMSNPDWIKNALPAETIAWERSRGLPGENEKYETIINGMSKFYSKLIHALGK